MWECVSRKYFVKQFEGKCPTSFLSNNQPTNQPAIISNSIFFHQLVHVGSKEDIKLPYWPFVRSIRSSERKAFSYHDIILMHVCLGIHCVLNKYKLCVLQNFMVAHGFIIWDANHIRCAVLAIHSERNHPIMRFAWNNIDCFDKKILKPMQFAGHRNEIDNSDLNYAA